MNDMQFMKPKQLLYYFLIPVLIACSEDKQYVSINQQANNQLPDSAVYEGDYKDGKFHGDGKLTWRNGDVYIGEFENGLMHGDGTLSTATGDSYEGEYVDGLWEGQGHVRYKAGGEYKGEFKAGEFNGQGIFTSYDGVIYEGEFRDSRQHGKGKVTYKTGNTYEGDIENWILEGNGVYMTVNDGVIYSGQFVKGSQEGKGEIKRKNGEHYIGEIKGWSAHGMGVLTKKNGDKYTGSFEYGMYEGKGVLHYKNGDSYEGEFQSGSPHGMGTYTRAKPKGRKKVETGYWEYGRYQGPSKPDKTATRNNKSKRHQASNKVDAEAVFYSQSDLMEKALITLQPNRPGIPDMYFLGFAGYGSQDVFMKETNFAKQMFDRHLNTEGRSLVLVNHRNAVTKTPLASVTNLKTSLNKLAKVMDLEEDILFLYLTSHGSSKHELDVHLKGLPLNDLPAKSLAEMIKQSGIKWKVIVVSACYSGGFIKALKDDYTVVMTSARSDHVSFGCSDEAEFTYFGRALLKESIPSTNTFSDAFEKARGLVTEWEDKEKYDHSDPQFWSADKIEQHLSAWRAALPERTALNP